MKTRRTHDKIYLKENRYEKTKEAFKFIIDKVSQMLILNQN